MGRFALAIFLAHLNEQRVKFVEQGLVGRELLVQELLSLRVTGIRRKQPVTRKNPPRVSISNKEGLMPCVEDNGIGGFRSHAPYLEKLLPQLASRE